MAVEDHALHRASFNPTLVRLRPDGFLSFGERHSCFNPTLVRLRRCNCGVQRCSNKDRFNPTLVRLRRDVVANFDLGEELVSIPRWFD